MRATVRLTAVAAAVALAAGTATSCSAAIGGRGEYAAAPVPAGTAPNGLTSSAPAPSPSAASYDPGRATLACGAHGAVAPRNAPYCYLLPAGFRDVSGQIRLGAGTGNADHVSAVGLAGRDLIVVMAYRPPSNTDSLPDSKIEHDLQPVLASLAAAGFVFATRTAETSRVDRARAFSYRATSRDGSFHSELTFVFRGLSEAEVLCQYAKRKAAVLRACRQVLGSLQVRTVQ